MRDQRRSRVFRCPSLQIIPPDRHGPFKIQLGNFVQPVTERSFAWATRFRRLVKGYERYASTLAGLHLVAFVCIMLQRVALLATGS